MFKSLLQFSTESVTAVKEARTVGSRSLRKIKVDGPYVRFCSGQGQIRITSNLTKSYLAQLMVMGRPSTQNAISFVITSVSQFMHKLDEPEIINKWPTGLTSEPCSGDY